jgi:hypothetical protein
MRNQEKGKRRAVIKRKKRPINLSHEDKSDDIGSSQGGFPRN